jgi:hypothetical protein
MRRSTALIRTATCRVARGLREDTGEQLTGRQLAQRVGWLSSLVADIGQATIDAHWDRTSLTALTADETPSGRKLSAQGYTACRQLWGPAALPPGTAGSSRIACMGAELAARQLRAAAHRMAVVDCLLTGLTPQECADPVTGRSYRRRIGRMLDSGQQLPRDLFEIERQGPRVPALVPLSATDHVFFIGQAAETEHAAHLAVDRIVELRLQRNREYLRARTAGTSLDRRPRVPRESGAVYVVRLRLPVVARPARDDDWSWHRITINIPPRYRTGTLSPPTLRVTTTGVVRADVAVSVPPPQRRLGPKEKPSRVLAQDWGARRLVTATVVTAIEHSDGRREATADGRPLHFQIGRLQAKARRIGRERAKVTAKIDRYARLLTGSGRRSIGEGGDHADTLRVRNQHLEVQAARLERKQRNINAAIARLAARWSVEQALENDCQAIAVENLRTLEARGMGARTNERVSLALRGRTATATREAAAAEGLVVIEVTASGTSTYCPRCDRKLRHRLHPDGGNGRSWAYCPGCGFNADRDHSAAEKIGQRALSTTAVRVRRQRSARRRAPTTEICRGEAAAAASEHQPSGPGAVRPVASPLPPAARRGGGHRSAGAGPRLELHQAGRQRMRQPRSPANRLETLLRTHRTVLRATGSPRGRTGSAQRGTLGANRAGVAASSGSNHGGKARERGRK